MPQDVNVMGKILWLGHLIILIYSIRCRNFNKLLIMLTTADSLWIGISIVESLAFAHTFSNPEESEPLWYRVSYPYFIHPMRYSVLGRKKDEIQIKSLKDF